jgi:hypothetical protein
VLTLLGLALDCDPPISASRIAGITGMYQHAQIIFLMLLIFPSTLFYNISTLLNMSKVEVASSNLQRALLVTY